MTPSPAWQPPRLTTGRTVASITPRQADVLTGLAHGLTNLQIARRLYLSEQTVKTHAKALYRALGARDRAHAVALTVSGQVVVHIKEPS